MSSLEQQVRESATALRQAWVGLQKPPPSPSLPLKCYEHWTKRASLHDVLGGTTALFEARAVAWKLVGEVANAKPVYSKDDINNDPTKLKSPNAVKYGNIEMEYGVARHLVLTSYVSTVWSIYDRLANVCGRLSSIGDVANHQKQNPKLCEQLLGETEDQGKRKKQDTMGFGGHVHIAAAYAWPIKVSYKIRNWLVHEGYEEGSVLLFKGNGISDQFILHGDAIRHLQKVCGGENDGNKKGESTCISEKEDCWQHGDLLKILEQYNKEIDTMFAALLRWSVDSFVGQIKAFAARDQH